MKRNVTVAAVALGLTLGACSTPVRQKAPPVFFPPAPELPRVQFLTSFTGLKDIEEQSAFNRFVVGEKQDIKVDKPYGVGIHDGKIYVCDTNATVVVFDLARKRFGFLKGAVGPGLLRQPVNISIDADGTKYVSDPVRGQVVVFDREDEFVTAYGTPGAWRPVDAVPYEGRLYVADIGNGIVTVFDLQSGDQVKTIGDQGDASERLDRPSNLAFDPEGVLAVADMGRFQIVRYDRDGHFKGTVGRIGSNLGHFARPKGIAYDRDGLLYAVDASFNNVQIFSPQGRLLMFFGQGGEGPGDLLLPSKVTIDYDHLPYFEQYVNPGFRPEYLVLVTNQFGPKRVSVYAFGKEEGKRYPTDAELLQRVEELRRQQLEKSQPAR